MARMTDERIGANIKALRVKAGFKNQTELANKMCVSLNTISSMERKPLDYPLRRLQTLASAIGCQVEDFFDD